MGIFRRYVSFRDFILKFPEKRGEFYLLGEVFSMLGGMFHQGRKGGAVFWFKEGAWALEDWMIG